MALISEDQAIRYVSKALSAVGNLPANPSPDVIKNVSFAPFQQQHKIDFLNALKTALNKDGYDAPLSLELFENWKKAQDCIDYLLMENIVSPLPI